MNLRDWLTRCVTEYGERTAITAADKNYTYADMDAISGRVAIALKEMGVGRGDRVAIALFDGPEMVFIYLGAVRLGAVPALLDPKLKYAELSSLLKHARPKVLFAGDPVLGLITPHRDRFAPMLLVACGSEPSPGTASYDDLISRAKSAPPRPALTGANTAQIHYTSGPAFRPLGVMLSHQAVTRGVEISARSLQLVPADVVLQFALPLHHIFGLTILLLSAFHRGSRVVMLPATAISDLWSAVVREKVSVFMGVPYIFSLAASSAERDGIKESDLSALRLCVSAGAPLALSVKDRFEENTGQTLHQLYGLTEATVHITLTSLAPSHTPGSVGRLIKGWQLKVVDPRGNECAAGQQGEVVLRGPVGDGYYRDPETTAEIFRDGWLHTGDRGYISEDGEVFLTGLIKDIFIVKGQNIFPEDIEAVLETYPNISEAVTFSVADDIRGERIEAVVTLKNAHKITEKELMDHCRKYLANYKLPKRIRLIAFLPRDAEGNVSREVVREQYYR